MVGEVTYWDALRRVGEVTLFHSYLVGEVTLFRVLAPGRWVK